ncbi:MAG: SDR family NAD(P)-dependent oxidoreductase [Alphaproteobacteria bacterium]|nr:MAG: SDR family NAD(P)-dependent oxidoreductase [Alphaproteobacteria bacterium]
MADPVCAVIGVGPGIGLALVRRFATAGYRVAMVSRSAERLAAHEADIPQARGFAADAADPDSLRHALEKVAEELGPVSVLCYNAGSGSWALPEDTTVAEMEAAWRTNALGLLVAAQTVAPSMLEAGRGAIMVTGATASLRGRPRTTAFAAAKAAQRSLAESLARHWGPRGIHVALFVIDGVVDLPRTRDMLPDKPDDFFLKPADIAETIFFVAHQPASAWSFQIDLRPFGEAW